MSDETIRRLERIWKAEGSAESEANYLREMVRLSVVSKESLQLLLAAGSPGASKLLGTDAERLLIGKGLQDFLEELEAFTPPKLGVVSVKEFMEFLVRTAGSVGISLRNALLRGPKKQIHSLVGTIDILKGLQHSLEIRDLRGSAYLTLEDFILALLRTCPDFRRGACACGATTEDLEDLTEMIGFRGEGIVFCMKEKTKPK